GAAGAAERVVEHRGEFGQLRLPADEDPAGRLGVSGVFAGHRRWVLGVPDRPAAQEGFFMLSSVPFLRSASPAWAAERGALVLARPARSSRGRGTLRGHL